MYDIGATEINDYLMEKWFKDTDYTRTIEPDCRSCIYRNQCDAIGEVKRCSSYYRL
jgi:hypothetical protein